MGQMDKLLKESAKARLQIIDSMIPPTHMRMVGKVLRHGLAQGMLNHLDTSDLDTSPEAVRNARASHSLEHNTITRAPMYVWDEESLSLAYQGAQSFPLSARFEPQWLLSPSGVYWLGKHSPLLGRVPHLVDIGETRKVDFIAYTLFNCNAFLDDCKTFDWRFEDDAKAGLFIWAYSMQGDVQHLWSAIWYQGETLEKLLSYRPDTGQRDFWVENQISIGKFLASAFNWTSQKLISLERARPSITLPNSVRALVQKTETLIVTVRRKIPKTKEGESLPRDWSHRWIVHGHWRNQPTKEGSKVIWIDNYVKGPEDKPLWVKERKFVVSR